MIPYDPHIWLLPGDILTHVDEEQMYLVIGIDTSEMNYAMMVKMIASDENLIKNNYVSPNKNISSWTVIYRLPKN
jgi:lipid A disaccharide synthetase